MSLKSILLILAAVILLSFSACLQEECEAEFTYQGYEPIILYPEDFRIEISAETPRELCTPSGFYYYQDHLFVIEYNEGLHIINNSDPSNPRFVTFLPVKAAVGLAVSHDILYVNNATDLVTFDLSDPAQPQMLDRVEDVFPVYSALTAGHNISNNGVVIDYVLTEVTRTVDCTQNRPASFFWDDDILFIDSSLPASEALINSANQDAGPTRRTTGIGGSLARFTINNGTLYSVDDSELKTFDLSNAGFPAEQGTVQLGWGIETIFPYGDLLFIGSRTGMHIYDGTDPLNPEHLSTFQHAQSCDPVYVQGDLAYVTLRSGQDEDWCNTVTNRMEIVDISDPRNPSLVEQYDLNFPAGLTVTDELLFLCEGPFGFRVFELQPDGLLGEELAVREDIDAMDVIGLHWLNQLITIDETGLAQMSYTENGQLSELSQMIICDN